MQYVYCFVEEEGGREGEMRLIERKVGELVFRQEEGDRMK